MLPLTIWTGCIYPAGVLHGHCCSFVKWMALKMGLSLADVPVNSVISGKACTSKHGKVWMGQLADHKAWCETCSNHVQLTLFNHVTWVLHNPAYHSCLTSVVDCFFHCDHLLYKFTCNAWRPCRIRCTILNHDWERWIAFFNRDNLIDREPRAACSALLSCEVGREAATAATNVNVMNSVFL